MERFDVDVLVSGGGIAGLTAACAFGAAGYSVICVDPAPPITQATTHGADLRSTAFLQPARDTLISAGIWDHLKPYATPLQIMRLADAGGAENEIRTVADFDAAEISDEPFAWNLPNWLLRREMLARIDELPNVTLRPGVATARITPRDTQVIVQLSNTTQVRARMLIAADGRDSFVRQALGIKSKRWTYGQRGIVFTVAHPDPHKHISTEIHRTGGPFTTVPLPDENGAHHSSIVWMETTAKAAALMDLSDANFNTAATQRSCGILGDLTLTSKRACWPIICQQANHLTAQRTALIAEAAHVIPPIGAQGLNMSLADIETLLSLATPENLGDGKMLNAYDKIRKPEIDLRVRGVDLLNRAAMAENENLRALRLKGLQTLHGLAPLRRTLMKKGLGA